MFKRYFIYGVIILSGILFINASHKFYVSISQIDVNTNSKKLEISVRIFTDDLEASIIEEMNKKLGLGTTKESPEADSILFQYLRNEMGFNQEGENLLINYIGKEVEADVTWIYAESLEGINLTEPIIISNGLLYERFPEQKNIVNLRFNNKTISEIHTKSHPEYSYKIESN